MPCLDPLTKALETTTIRPVEGEAELTQLCRLRARVYFGEKILNRNPSTVITDERDHWPETLNLVAVTDSSQVVGGVRIVFGSDNRVSAQTRYFDFRPHLDGGDPKAATGELFLLAPEYRSTAVGPMMLRTMLYLVALGEMDYFCVAARPVLMDHFSQFGFRAIGEPFDHPIERVPVVPAIVNLTEEVSITDLAQLLDPVLDLAELGRSVRNLTA